MAKNYTRPLAEVYQLLEVTRQATGDHLSACIVGPTYDLYRYGIEKDVTGYTYNGAATLSIAYAQDSTMVYKLDNESVAIYADNVEKVVLAKDDSVTWTAVTGSNRKVKCSLTLTDSKFVRQPAVGDIIYVKGNVPTPTVTSWQKRTIIDIDIINSIITVDAPFVFGSAGTTTCAITSVTSGYIPAKGEDGTTNWTHVADSKTITLPSAIKIDGMNLLAGAGTLYPEFRVLKYVNDDDEDIFEITTISDIQNNFGTIDILNDLAYGCYCALRGSAGRAIYAIRTAGVDEAAFEKAMKKTEFDSSVYSFAPLTSNPDVADIVVKYNEAMSAPDVKMWRRTLVGVDNPGEYVLAEKGDDAKSITANVAPTTTGAKTGTVTINSGNLNLKAVALENSYISVRPGDKIIAGTTEYTVVGTTSETVAEVYSEDGVTTQSGVSVKIVKADSVANTVEYVGAIAHKYANRRASVVFCDGGTTTEDDRVVNVPNRFIAAEIAGISSAVVPQQSITHTVIQSINKASHMYSRYTTAQLDDIAASGVLIVTQDTKGTDCYIRHQLTTEMDKGNLYYEESCTRNLDNISYVLADIVNGYIGKANVTTSALRSIKIDITAALNEFTQNSTDDMVGPSLVDWDTLEVYQDPKFKDRVIINVNLYLPLPLNNIKLFAMAYVATVSI